MPYVHMTYADSTCGRLAIPLACINCIQINMIMQQGNMGKKDQMPQSSLPILI